MKQRYTDTKSHRGLERMRIDREIDKEKERLVRVSTEQMIDKAKI